MVGIAPEGEIEDGEQKHEKDGDGEGGFNQARAFIVKQPPAPCRSAI